jgi:hypothetical protein
VRLSVDSAEHGDPFPFAVLTALGFVFELLVVEKKLFTGCEHEVRATVYALQLLVLEFHARGTPFPVPAPHGETEMGKGFGPDVRRGFFSPWVRPTMRSNSLGYCN